MKVYIVMDIFKEINGSVEDFDNSIDTTRVFSSYDKAYECILELMDDGEEVNPIKHDLSNGWMFTYEDGSGNFYIIEKELE